MVFTAQSLKVPFFVNRCGTEPTQIMCSVLLALKYVLKGKRWAFHEISMFNFDTVNLPAMKPDIYPFIAVYLSADIPENELAILEQCATRGIAVFGLMIDELPEVRSAFLARGGKACLVTPLGSNPEVAASQFWNEHIPAYEAPT